MSDLGLDLDALAATAAGHALPPGHPGGWAMHEATCRLLGALVGRVGAERVLEFGSGFSSVVIAAELTRRGAGRVDSVDHSPAWSGAARALAETRGVAGRVEFHRFPLRLRIYPGLPCVFYAVPVAFYAGRAPYDLVVVDGPPADIGRDGGLPEAFGRLRPGGWLLFDDARADHMRATLGRWLALFAGRVAHGELPEVGNGVGLLRKLDDRPPAPARLPPGARVRQWLRAARSLGRARRLG